MHFDFRALAALLIIALVSQKPAVAGTFKVLHQFTGTHVLGGASPQAGLVIDGAGNLYGTTLVGGIGTGCGADGCGTVFKLSPPVTGETQWSYSVLHHFKNTDNDGAFPFAKLLLTTSGALVGTTQIGGTGGVVFQLTPKAGGGWAYAVIYYFRGGKRDGLFPIGEVIEDSEGALYLTTQQGGTRDAGTVMKLMPPATGELWTGRVLHSFAKLTGDYPGSGLVQGADNVLYGVTEEGGVRDIGVIFSLTEPASGDSEWTYAVARPFHGPPNDGEFGNSTPLSYKGSLYGTTDEGGTSNAGTVYVYKPPNESFPNGIYKVLYSFDFTHGAQITSSLIADAHGRLWGVASGGGAKFKGTVFSLLPGNSRRAPVIKTWHNFSGGIDGDTPFGGLISDAADVKYGTTSGGGMHGFGTIFAIDPHPAD